MSPHCTQCGTPGMAGDKYCGKCAAELVQPSAGRCPSCSLSLGGRPYAGERKIINFCPHCREMIGDIPEVVGVQSTSDHPDW